MSGLFGTQEEEDYFQVGTVKLPLPKSAEGRAGEFETLRTTPLEPFQASTVLGDSSLISDDRIAQAVFSDFRPGLGKRRFVAAESLSGYQDANLLTVEGIATLPISPTLINSALDSSVTQTAVSTHRPACTGFGFDWAARYQFACWQPGFSRLYVYDQSTLAFVLPTTIPVDFPPYSGVATFGGYYVACVSSGIYYSTDGHAFTASWVPGGSLVVRGLVNHDNKLYAVIQDTAIQSITLRWIATAAQLTAGVAWPGAATDYFPLDPNESVVNVVDWKDERNNRQIFISTSKRIMAYDDADFFDVFWRVPDWYFDYYPFLFVSPRDDLLYACFGGQSNSVLVFNHQTIEETGPNKEFGLPYDAGAFTIGLLTGNTRHMFALGTTVGSPGTQGRVLIANDAFGWSSFYRSLGDPVDFTVSPAANERITGMFYFAGRLVTIKHGGKVEYLPWPDRPVSTYNLPTSGAYARPYIQGPAYLYSPEFDAGNELLHKLAKWWTLHLEDPSNASGPSLNLPTGCSLTFGYQFDGGSWTTYPTTINALSAFPYRIPLPDANNQAGMVFRKLRFRVGLQGASAGTLITPILRAVTLAYTREPDIYDGLQVVIDLSEQRFRLLDGQVFYGRDRQYLRNFIETLKSGPTVAKTHYPVTYSYGGNVRAYASVDVRVSATEDPQDGYGHYTLTLRDISAPLSG